MMTPPLAARDIAKTFVMHLRGGLRLPVFSGVTFEVKAGECLVLGGPSGVGKSSILKMLYGNYSVDTGSILVAHRGGTVDIARAEPRAILDIRRESIGYVSQFLRAIPRVAALDVVAEPLIVGGTDRAEAGERAEACLARLNLPRPLWSLPPATFSGGEQQRVNIARGFLSSQPVLLLDEPTASLDDTNRTVVVDMIEEKKAAGVALVGIFHDTDVRDRVASRVVDVAQFSARGVH